MATITMDFEVQSLVKKDKEKIDFRRFIKEYKHKKTFFLLRKTFIFYLKKVIWLFLMEAKTWVYLNVWKRSKKMRKIFWTFSFQGLCRYRKRGEGSPSVKKYVIHLQIKKLNQETYMQCLMYMAFSKAHTE